MWENRRTDIASAQIHKYIRTSKAPYTIGRICITEIILSSRTIVAIRGEGNRLYEFAVLDDRTANLSDNVSRNEMGRDAEVSVSLPLS